MASQTVNKLKVSLVSALLIIGLTAGPAKADHYHNVIAPIATFAALSYLFNHNNQHHGYYSHKRKRTHHGHKKHHRIRRHNHSQGGYSHNQKRYNH